MTLDSLTQFLEWIKSQGLALFSLFYSYEQGKIDHLEMEKQALELQVQEGANQDAIKAKYADKSAIDIVNQSILDGGGTASDLINGPTSADSPDVPIDPGGNNGTSSTKTGSGSLPS